MYLNKVVTLGHSRKRPYHLHGRNRKLTPFGCPNTFTIIRNNFVSPPLWTAEISSVGGVWIFSGTTHFKFCHKLMEITGNFKNDDIASCGSLRQRRQFFAV